MAKSPNPIGTPTAPAPTRIRGAPAPKARIVVTQTITHVPLRGEPTSLAVGVARNCDSDELPYRRPSGSFVIDKDWRPLDLGWFGETDAKVGQIALYNTEGTTLEKIPTPEERAAIDRRVIEIGIIDFTGEPIPGFLIHPGDALRGLPIDVTKIAVRCRDPKQKIRCDLIIFPG